MTDGHAAETVATAGSTWLLRYVRSYPGRADQVRQVRAFLREALAGWPRADDVVGKFCRAMNQWPAAPLPSTPSRPRSNGPAAPVAVAAGLAST